MDADGRLRDSLQASGADSGPIDAAAGRVPEMERAVGPADTPGPGRRSLNAMPDPPDTSAGQTALAPPPIGHGPRRDAGDVAVLHTTGAVQGG